MRNILYVYVVVACCWAFAQEGREDEADNIERRIEWFRQTRQLDRFARPDQLRRNAIADLKADLAARAPFGTGDNWTQLGPAPMTMLSWTMGTVAGRVAAIAYDPNDINILYVGAASGGVWKTTDGGTNWTPIFTQVGTQTIGSLLVENSDSIWVGTGEHYLGCGSYFGMGLWHSADGGATFEEANGSGAGSLPLSQVSALAIHPSNNQIILAGGGAFCSSGTSLGRGLFRSVDRAQTWNATDLTGKVEDILADLSVPGTFYAGSTGQGVYKSTNSGSSWTLLSNGLPSGAGVSRIRLAMAPSNAQVLYALVTSGGTQLYKSTNGGQNWTTQNTSACEGQCSYDLCLDVHPTDPDQLLVGSIRFAQSTNSGTTLTYLTSNWGSGQKVHQDTHVLLYNRNNGNQFWVGSDGGIWRTDDGGSNFVNLNGNLNITELYDIAVDPTDATRLFGGAQDNSSSRTVNQQLWNVTRVTGDGFMNLVDPLNPQIVIQTSYPSGGRPNLYRSISGGDPNSFVQLNMSSVTQNEPWPWVTPLAIVAHQGSSYYFVGSHRPYLSANTGTSWTALANAGFTPNSIRVMVPYSNGANLALFVGVSNGQIFRCDNVLAGTPVWMEITNNFPAASVSDLAIEPGNANHIYATRESFGSAQLYESTNGGASWNPIGNGIPNNPANSVAIDPINLQRVFVATDIGVFVSYDAGQNFIPLTDGMPLGLPVVDLEIDDDPYMLSAASYGRGAWQMDLSQALTVNAGLDVIACADTWASVLAAATNVQGPASYQWDVVSQPGGSSVLWQNQNSQNALVQADIPGDYELEVQVSATNGISSDILILHVGTDATATLQDHWPIDSSDSNWLPSFDRDGSGRISVLDLLIQMVNPVCL